VEIVARFGGMAQILRFFFDDFVGKNGEILSFRQVSDQTGYFII
jgi:hypothetical protein